MTDLAMAEPETAEDQSQVLPLEQIALNVELAKVLPADKLNKYAEDCKQQYERDEASRSSWKQQLDAILTAIDGEKEAKTFPWPGASNVRYPIIMQAALQFHANAYPAIINNDEVVKAKVKGADPDGQKRARGDRVATHMNHQLLDDMPEWHDETDRLCLALPIQGTLFRQVIWDHEYARPKTTLVNGFDFVVNNDAKDLETVPQFTKCFTLFQHEIETRMRTGKYRKAELGIDDEDGAAKAQDMLECHCRLDLDEDGYDEPYILILHKESGECLSLKAGFWPKGVERSPDGQVLRIRRHVEFTKYEFLPDPKGGYYGIGLGQLLLEHGEVINTLLNQLMDAATDQNAGGGFIGRGLRLSGGNLEFSPGEWKQINAPGGALRDNIVPRPTAQPSAVTFALLEFILGAAKEIGSIRDVLSGEAPANQAATTTLALIEQGMKVSSSIYKRIYRANGRELGLIYRLNGAYLPPELYLQVIDEPEAPPELKMMDYRPGDYDIKPVSDPSTMSSAQKLARAQVLMGFAGNPIVDQREIIRRSLEAANIDNIEALMPEPDPQQQQLQMQQMQMQMRMVMAEIMAEEADAMESAASAKLKEVQANVAAQEAMIELAAMRMTAHQLMGGIYGPGAMGGMAGMAVGPTNAAIFQPAFGIGPQGRGPVAPGGMGGPGAGRPNGGASGAGHSGPGAGFA